jgi:uncharacterized Zn-binding protein involved in type VI secretion
MPGFVQRVGDSNSGGGVIITGNPTVLVNGRPIATLGSSVAAHPPCSKVATHCWALTTTTQYTVLVGGKPVTTTGAPDTCGCVRSTGSLNVIIGVPGAPV